MINPVEYKEKFTNLVSALGRHTGGQRRLLMTMA